MKVRETLSGSFKMLREKPIFLLPLIIPLVLSVSDIRLRLYVPAFKDSPAFFALSIIVTVLSVLAGGMYPSMVRDHIEKMELSFKDSFRFSYHKFWSLLGAVLLAVFVIVAVIYAIAIPSALLLIYTQNSAVMIDTMITVMIVFFLIGPFFYYICPAIMMDDMKAVAGLKRSIEVGKKNYLFTLIIFSIPTAIMYAVSKIFIELPVRLGATSYISILSLLISLIIDLFMMTWMIIMMSYTYYKIRS
jgi:hypothetical protein